MLNWKALWSEPFIQTVLTAFHEQQHISPDNPFKGPHQKGKWLKFGLDEAWVRLRENEFAGTIGSYIGQFMELLGC